MELNNSTAFILKTSNPFLSNTNQEPPLESPIQQKSVEIKLNEVLN